MAPRSLRASHDRLLSGPPSGLDHARRDLQRNGYARFSASGLRQYCHAPWRIIVARMLQGLDRLSIDEYDPQSNRFRAYARAVILPWHGTLFWIPDSRDQFGNEWSAYFQGTFNPEYPGTVRRFRAVPAALKQSPLLTALIWRDFRITSWTDLELAGPIHVGVHLVCHRVDEDNTVAVASPNHLHRDGETYTFAHLVDQQGITGGANVIADVTCDGKDPSQVRSEDVRARFTLVNQLDSYAVRDDAVSHYVSPVEWDGRLGQGHRAVFLIDYVPMTSCLQA